MICYLYCVNLQITHTDFWFFDKCKRKNFAILDTRAVCDTTHKQELYGTSKARKTLSRTM